LLFEMFESTHKPTSFSREVPLNKVASKSMFLHNLSSSAIATHLRPVKRTANLPVQTLDSPFLTHQHTLTAIVSCRTVTEQCPDTIGFFRPWRMANFIRRRTRHLSTITSSIGIVDGSVVIRIFCISTNNVEVVSMLAYDIQQ
jgi:hypothetical protein